MAYAKVGVGLLAKVVVNVNGNGLLPISSSDPQSSNGPLANRNSCKVAGTPTNACNRYTGTAKNVLVLEGVSVCLSLKILALKKLSESAFATFLQNALGMLLLNYHYAIVWVLPKNKKKDNCQQKPSDEILFVWALLPFAAQPVHASLQFGAEANTWV